MYYKNSLALKLLDIRFLHERIAFDLRIDDKLCHFISLSRSPNRSFLDNFELPVNTLAQKNLLQTDILNNSYSCIDLIFNSQPNLLIKSGDHPSLHSSCHHQMIFAKFSLDM